MKQTGKGRRKAGGIAHPKLAFIENRGPDNFRDFLRAEVKDAQEVCIAVAFITSDGLDQILQSLSSAAAHGNVRILTGLYQYFTHPSALRALLTVQEQTRHRLSVCLSKEPQFHRKLYVIRNMGRASIIIGSSNLTGGGLESGGELNALVRLSANSLGYREAVRIFNADWKHACDLNKGQIERYRRKRPPKTKDSAYTPPELNDILGAKAKHRGAPKLADELKIWRTATASEATSKSSRIVEERTNWDDRGYDWWVEGQKSPCQLGDKVFLFDCVDKYLSLVQIVDFAHPKTKNADGTHFVAYRQVGKYNRRFTPKMWLEVKAIGITKGSACDSHENQKVDSSLAEKLKTLIRGRKRN